MPIKISFEGTNTTDNWICYMFIHVRKQKRLTAVRKTQNSLMNTTSETLL